MGKAMDDHGRFHHVPTLVERYDPDGVDYGWIMQVTFVLTIVIGAPIIALGSMWVELTTWGERAQFAAGFGSVIWLVVASVVFAVALRSARDRAQ